MPTRGHINGDNRIGSHRGRGHIITNPVTWSGRTQDNQNIARQILGIIQGPGGAPGLDGEVVWNNGGVLDSAPIWTFGFWAPLTNGDPVSPELIFDSVGDCVVGFVPQPPPEE